MSETTETDAQEADVTTAQAATTEPTTEVESTPTTDAQAAEGVISAEDARKLRSEARSLRQRVKAAEEAVEAQRLAEMSEAEKAKDRAEKAEARANEAFALVKSANLTASVAVEAAKLGVDPTLARKLIAEGVEFDDNGTPQGVADALKDLVEQYPNLTVANGGAGQTTNPGRQPPTEEKETDAQRYSRLFGGNANAMWDPARGGVKRPVSAQDPGDSR